MRVHRNAARWMELFGKQLVGLGGLELKLEGAFCRESCFHVFFSSGSILR